MELSFHPCNILRNNRRGVSRETKMWAAVPENGDFFLPEDIVRQNPAGIFVEN